MATRDELRFGFLEEVEERAPRALANLKTTVFPLYVDGRGRYGGGADADAFLATHLTADPPPVSMDLAPLRLALRTWSERWHLVGTEEPWCVRAAVEAMASWSAPPVERRWTAVGAAAVVEIVDGMREPLRVAPPRVVRDTAVGLSWGVGSFRDADDGRERRPRTRSREHFSWLVRHQIDGESFGQIARMPGALPRRWRGRVKAVSARAVEKAVKALAARIGLRLREPDKGGRPPKPPK